jgi:protein transport protein SEC31
VWNNDDSPSKVYPFPQVFIWDLANNPEIPYTPGAHSSTNDEQQQLTKVAWNCQVPYILSTCFSNGQTVILDLRSKKKVMELVTKDHLSSVVWHPDIVSIIPLCQLIYSPPLLPFQATQLVTASTDDTHPVVTSWDLRRAHTPEKTMRAHSKGVLDLSWCRQDSELLVSSGKDGRILSWNPRTALHSEIAKTDSSSVQIDFCPRNPNWLASASLSGEVRQPDHIIPTVVQ